MTKLIPFERCHIDEVDLHWIYNTDLDCKMRWHDCCQMLVEGGLATTIIHDGVILGIIAFVPLWSGVYDVWTLASTHIHTYKMTYFKLLKRGIKIYTDLLQIRRLQGTIRADVDFATKWIQYLGFEKEAIMEGYGPSGEAHYMFARVS